MAHTVAFAEGTFNPVAQMGNPECFELFTTEELDAIQWDSLEEEMARSVEYDIVPDYDKLLDIMTAAKRGARLTARLRRRLRAAPADPASSVGGAAADALRLELGGAVDRDRPRRARRASSSPSSGRRARGKTTLLRMLAGMETPQRRRHPAARQAHQRRAGEPAADLPRVPVAGAVPAPDGRREHRVSAEDEGRRRPAAGKRAGAGADAHAAPAGEPITARTCTQVLRRRAAARGAGPRLAYDPEILFFDEPLSAIDYKLRKTLEKELKDIHRETGKTFIYITHSLEEAMVMSDRIGVMRGGRLVQVGTPRGDLHRARADQFVSEFMGDVNVIAGHAQRRRQLRGRRRARRTSAAPVTAIASAGYLVIRPEFLRFVATPAEAENSLDGTALQRICAGLAHPVPGARRRAGLHRREARAAGLSGRPRRAVLIGWDAGDAIFVPG